MLRFLNGRQVQLVEIDVDRLAWRRAPSSPEVLMMLLSWFIRAPGLTRTLLCCLALCLAAVPADPSALSTETPAEAEGAPQSAATPVPASESQQPAEPGAMSVPAGGRQRWFGRRRVRVRSYRRRNGTRVRSYRRRVPRR